MVIPRAVPTPIIRKQKQFRSTMNDLLTTLFCRSFQVYASFLRLDRYLTGPGGNADGSPVPAATQPDGATRVSAGEP